MFTRSTCDDAADRSTSRGVVVKDMFGVGGFAAAASTQEDDGLVATCVEQRTKGDLRCCIDVRWHIFRLAALEHLYNLRKEVYRLR